MISALAIAALLGGGSCALVDATRIETRDGSFTLRQVVESDCPALAQTGDTVVAALPRETNRISVSRTALTALIRRRVPDLEIVEPAETSGQNMELRREAPAEAGSGASCFELSHAVTRGAALTQDALVQTGCTRERTPLALVYDSHNGLVHAAEAGAAGHYVGQLMALPADLIERNQPLQLRVTSGPVTITREVVALQYARTGDAIFVRDGEGHVFSAPSNNEREQ